MAEMRGPSRVEKLREAMGQKSPEKERAEALRSAGDQFKQAQKAYSQAESDLGSESTRPSLPACRSTRSRWTPTFPERDQLSDLVGLRWARPRRAPHRHSSSCRRSSSSSARWSAWSPWRCCRPTGRTRGSSPIAATSRRGGPRGTRTHNQRIKSPMLCPLS